MSVNTVAPLAPSSRPIVSDVEETALGRSFSITFEPGQSLPTHANPSRVVISVVRGSGAIALVNDPGRTIRQGDFVQLDPNEPHAVVAGLDGLELQVSLVENCCRMC